MPSLLSRRAIGNERLHHLLHFIQLRAQFVYFPLSLGDLNGDGHRDVFLNNFGLPSAVWLNDGGGGLFDSGIRLPGIWQNTSCPLGDLDGDGDLDVFIAAYGDGPNEVWFSE